jgi:hypothetical protein
MLKSTNALPLEKVCGFSLRPVFDNGIIAIRPPGPERGNARCVEVTERVRRREVVAGVGGRDV